MSTHDFVLGTAGHIDHGKTTLIRALTGVDCDRLVEEKQRGITIVLGFAPIELASGRRGGVVAVPGHERLVRTMIAGAAGVDAVLFCVSASEGVMPQTREHLAILELLGLRHGVIAMTMVDAVDEELAELAAEEVRDEVAETFLADAPLVMTSAETAEGLDAVRAALAALPIDARAAGAVAQGPFRLPVDRCFVSRGFGSVVTGTVFSGRVKDGDEVEILPSGERARVRGIQVHGGKVSASAAGLRTALNLAGVERDDLARGSVICSPGGVPVTSVLDVRYRHLPGAHPLALGARVRLLLGTTEVMAVADPLDAEQFEPGASLLVQLRTAEPLACLPGDPFILRRESPVQTLGGGRVLDPWAPRVRRRDRAAAVALLRRMEAGDRLALADRAGPAGLSRRDAARLGDDRERAARLGERLLSPAGLAALEGHFLVALAAWHDAHPLATGAGKRVLHQGRLAPLDTAAFDALVRRLDADGRIRLEGPRLRLPGWEVKLAGAHREAAVSLRAALAAAALEALTAAEAAEGRPDGDALVALMVERGEVARIGPRLYLMKHLDELIVDVRAHLKARTEMSPGDFKALSGLTRRGAIPLLEWLDARGVTRRVGDVRVAGRG